MTLREKLGYRPMELAFGTSGLRGLVRDITNLEAYVGTRGFLAHLLDSSQVRPGDTVYIAGDLRPSTDCLVSGEEGRGEIAQAAAKAVEAAGLRVGYVGKIPTPALMLYAMRRSSSSIMVTGSHIPFDRNGIKFNKPSGEILKSDEAHILAAMKRIRAAEYGRPAEESFFDSSGMLKPSHRKPLPPIDERARKEYTERYVAAFPKGALAGCRILVWQHSAVGRDILTEILQKLGADAVPVGRSDVFVPVDTEAVGRETLELIQGLVDANGGASIGAAVSTDGDGDRPLVLGVERGRVRFFPGDLLGLAAADFLGARRIAVPISVNDAVDIAFSAKGVVPVKTRIGSPYVVAAMEEVGWEANGGFLTAAPIAVPGGGTLEPLPTRDAVLPILSVLSASLGRGKSLAALFDLLPPRFGRSALLREFPREKSLAIVELLSPRRLSLTEARFSKGSVSALKTGAGREDLAAGSPAAAELAALRTFIGKYFTPADGFGEVSWINWLDGVRIGFANGDVAHIRPSGNAPELRLYANADSQERADLIASLGTRGGGILRRLEAHAEEQWAIAAFRARPAAVHLQGAIQSYPWGGSRFIPELTGMDNSEGRPFAELWIGAHPRAPALARLPVPQAGRPGEHAGVMPVALDRLIAEAGEAVLGAAVSRGFGGKLPYLLKVLDARSMLSIQAHPSNAQAEAGFARETAAGIPITAANRTYADENHKPEVHVALTDFWMLHGFRRLEQIASILRSKGGRAALRAPEIAKAMPDFGDRLKDAGPDERARRALLRELYERLMTMPQEEVDRVLKPLVERLRRAQPSDKDSPDYWALEAARSFTRDGHLDRGVFSIYLLNLVRLRPGQGTYQPSGTLHAYLEGANVELMANSDNVLRGGLTTKHVDTAELLAILTFESGAPPVLEGQEISETERVYTAPAREFLLSRIEAAPHIPHRARGSHGPDCLIVMEGEAELKAAGDLLPLKRGGIALVPAGLPYTIESRAGTAVVFKAGVPAAVGK